MNKEAINRILLLRLKPASSNSNPTKKHSKIKKEYPTAISPTLSFQISSNSPNCLGASPSYWISSKSINCLALSAASPPELLLNKI